MHVALGAVFSRLIRLIKLFAVALARLRVFLAKLRGNGLGCVEVCDGLLLRQAVLHAVRDHFRVVIERLAAILLAQRREAPFQRAQKGPSVQRPFLRRHVGGRGGRGVFRQDVLNGIGDDLRDTL